MDLRIPVAIIALFEVIAPRRFNRAWIRIVSPDADEVELRPWVAPVTRLEGLLLLGWVAWRSREELRGYAPEEIDTGIDIDQIGEPEPTVIEDGPTLTPGTRRHDIASVLYHADDPLAASDVVELSEGTDWEMGRSTASATLYRMHNDGLVDRKERPDDGSFMYWLTSAAEDILETGDEPIDPNPFAA